MGCFGPFPPPHILLFSFEVIGTVSSLYSRDCSCMVLPKCVDPLNCSHSKFHIYGVPGQGALEEAKEEVICQFEFMSHSL